MFSNVYVCTKSMCCLVDMFIFNICELLLLAFAEAWNENLTTLKKTIENYGGARELGGCNIAISSPLGIGALQGVAFRTCQKHLKGAENQAST